MSQSSNPGSPLLVVDNRSDITEKTALSVGFMLDSLLAEKTEKVSYRTYRKGIHR